MGDERTLFIGNIDKNVTEEILYELFLQAGPVERVSMPSGRNEYARYGFVTYKHESSVNYAIELFKGTVLFKKELSIKKRCPKGNNPDSSKCENADQSQRMIPNIMDFQGQLQALKFLAQNLTYGPQQLINFTSNNLWESNNPGRNRSHDVGTKNPFSRPRDVRDRWKDRSYGNKVYHGRKNRHRD